VTATSGLQRLVALAVAGGLSIAAAEPMLDASSWAITELNQIGRSERARQAQVRTVACQASPEGCPPPVPAWVDAPLLRGQATSPSGPP